MIEKETDPKRKNELRNALTFSLFDESLEKVNEASIRALKEARESGDQHSEGWALANRGLYFFFSGIHGEARDYFEQALAIGSAQSDYSLETYSLTQLGNVSRDKGAFDSALHYYDLAEQSSLIKKDLYYRSVVRMNQGRLYLTIHKPDSALRVLKNALRLREELKDSMLMADTWILIGNCYRGKDDFARAEQYYKKAQPLTQHDAFIKADYTQNMGEIYFRNGNFQSAVENWSKVLAFHRKYQYKYGLAELLLRMGAVFAQQGYFGLATDYLADALMISEKSGFRYQTGLIIFEQAWVYYRAKNYTLALDYLHKAERIFKSTRSETELAGTWDLKGLIEKRRKNFDSALYYHKKSLTERLRLRNKADIDNSLFNMGEFYLATENYKAALPYYFKSLHMGRAFGDNYGQSMNCNRIGNVYLHLLRFDSAKFYLELSMKLGKPTSANELFRVNYFDMAAYFEKIGQPAEANRYYKKYIQLSDSMYNKQTVQSLASYRTLYDVETNEQQMELLNKDYQLSKADMQRQRIVLYAAIAGSVIFLTLAGFYYRFSRRLSKLNTEIAEKNEEIQAQAEELTESNLTISGINERLEERIEARTSELKQAFKELDTFFYRSSHDFRRPLTTFMGLAEVARVLVKDPAALELFEKVNENAINLDKMLRKLQSVSDVDMQTLIYKEVSLREIFEIELYEMKQELDSRKIRTTLTVKLNHPFYSYGALIKIIVQNLLENSIAFCTPLLPVIHISAYEQGGEVIIEVQDNGQGIAPEYLDRVFEMYLRANEHSKGNGLGLYIVRKTVQKLNGQVTLQSELGKGTTVRVLLPQQLNRTNA